VQKREFLESSGHRFGIIMHKEDAWRSNYMCLDGCSTPYPMPGLARNFSDPRHRMQDTFAEKGSTWFESDAGQGWYGEGGIAYGPDNVDTKITCPSYAFQRLAVTPAMAQLDHAVLVYLPFLLRHGSDDQKRKARAMQRWVNKLERRFGTKYDSPNRQNCLVQREMYFTMRCARFTCMTVEQLDAALVHASCDFARIEVGSIARMCGGLPPLCWCLTRSLVLLCLPMPALTVLPSQAA
jgi:hypothetical protein